MGKHYGCPIRNLHTFFKQKKKKLTYIKKKYDDFIFGPDDLNYKMVGGW